LLNQADKFIEDQILKLANAEAPINAEKFSPLLSKLKRVECGAGERLFDIGDKNELEYFVISGLLRTYVINDEGSEVTLGFYDAPKIVSPSFTRCARGVSLVFCEALEAAVVYQFPFVDLVNMMTKDSDMNIWGNAVLRNDLLKRSQRELALVSMNGSKRLQDFRGKFGDLESRIPHSTIASYLGMTAVSLSRLRHAR